MTEDPLAQDSAQLLRALDFAAEIAALREEYEEHLRRLLDALFEAIDSFDRLLAGTAEDGEEAWQGTVRRIAGQLERALAQAGVMEIQCMGAVADPRRHQIVDVQPVDGAEDDIIIEVLSRGWERNGKPVRLPRVIVARNPKEKKP